MAGARFFQKDEEGEAAGQRQQCEGGEVMDVAENHGCGPQGEEVGGDEEDGMGGELAQVVGGVDARLAELGEGLAFADFGQAVGVAA